MAQLPVRRVRRRPSMTESGTSGSASASSTPSSYESTGVVSAEREIDIPDLDDVRETMTQSAPQDFDPLMPNAGDGQSRPLTPAELLMERSEGGRATTSQIKLRRVMVARMMLRGIDRKGMSTALNVSEATVDKDVRAVKEELIRRADNLDIKEQVGTAMMFYKDIQHQTLRMATEGKNSNAVKLAALKTAMTAQADMTRFFKLSGVFDVLPFIVTAKHEKSDISKLTDLTKAVIAMEDDAEELLDDSYAESLERYLEEREKQLNDNTDSDEDLDLF